MKIMWHMKPKLLPHSFRRIGWLLLIPAFLGGVFLMIASDFTSGPEITTIGLFGDEILSDQNKPAIRFDQVALLPNLVAVVFLIGGVLVMFSKQKKEDEYINQMRLKSFQSAVLINYVLLFLSIIFIHGIPFFHVMVYNLFTVIIIYILTFQYLIFKNANFSHE